MEMIKGYMDNERYRKLLCEMTQSIFGFSFENWYRAGYYMGEYLPYSYMENGRIIANASANIMKFSYKDAEKTYIQIGTVMTRPEYRNRGLARELILEILKDYQKRTDGFYLFGNLNAVGFYDKLGFQRLDQWRWCWDAPVRRKGRTPVFQPADEKARDAYVQMLNHTVSNASFDHINRCSLQMFYTMNMDNVHYCGDLDCFAVFHTEADILYLDSIICSREVSVQEVVERIEGDYRKVVFGFTPVDKTGLNCEPFDGGEDYRFFYLGDELKMIDEERLYFPVMSHA